MSSHSNYGLDLSVHRVRAERPLDSVIPSVAHQQVRLYHFGFRRSSSVVERGSRKA